MAEVEVGEDYVTSSDLAARIGVKLGTFNGYERKAIAARANGRDRPGLVPKRDAVRKGVRIGWLPATADAYVAHRPGAGARTDIAAGLVESTLETDIQAARWRDVDGMTFTAIAEALGYASGSGAKWAVARGRAALERIDPTASMP